MKKFYKIVADINDESEIDFNAFVDVPAHMKGFIAFGKEAPKFVFSETGEKRLVTGVMISADTQIYRNFEDGNESYVSFSKETIDVLRKKFFAKGFAQNLNENHSDQIIKGATLVDSYIIDSTNPNFPTAPVAFEKQKLRDGTWIATYHVTDDKVWAKVKDGTFNGFSVEGFLDKVEIKIKTNINMKKEKKTVLDYLGFSNFNKQKFAEATTADGIVLSYEGELIEGETAFMMDSEGEMLPAPEGEHQITLEDGSVKIITLDAQGILVTITDFVEEPEGSTDELAIELRKEFAAALKIGFSELRKSLDERFASVESKFANLSKDDKFKHTGKKAGVETTKAGFKSLLK